MLSVRKKLKWQVEVSIEITIYFGIPVVQAAENHQPFSRVNHFLTVKASTIRGGDDGKYKPTRKGMTHTNSALCTK